MTALQSEPWVLKTSLFGALLHVGVAGEEEGRRRVGEFLREKGMGVRRIGVIAPSLEDVFLHLLERDAPKEAV